MKHLAFGAAVLWTAGMILAFLSIAILRAVGVRCAYPGPDDALVAAGFVAFSFFLACADGAGK